MPGAHAVVALVPGSPVQRRADEVGVGSGDGRHRLHLHRRLLNAAAGGANAGEEEDECAQQNETPTSWSGHYRQRA